MRTERVKLKICLVGGRGVGKTSLVRRYVFDAFDDSYIRTLGMKVSKKEVDFLIPDADLRVRALMQVWDIMGDQGFGELTRAAYFNGCQGILAVCDVSDPPSMGEVSVWLGGALDFANGIPVHLIVNKVDAEPRLRERDVWEFARERNMPVRYASARRGDNVRRAFEDLAQRITEPLLQARGHPVGPLATAQV